MINPIIAQIQSQIWMMEPRAMVAMVGKLLRIGADSLTALMKIEIQKNKPEMRINGGVAVINIHGVLMKDPPAWLAWFGIEATDYGQIRQQLAEAVGKTEVVSILLHIDSPGGTVAGSSETADAIETANRIKPVNAYIEDLGASGAYYLASQAKQIAANLNAEVGSIGVFTVYEDYSKAAEMLGIKVNVIRSGEHKGMGVTGAPITDEQIAAVQEIINGMAANFIAAVSKGRGIDRENIEKIATGRTWLADEAKKIGLIDLIATGTQEQESNNNLKGNSMAETKETKETPAVAEQKAAATVDIETVKNQADKEGRDRLEELFAAFPDEPKFVLEQFKAGADVAAAKAAFCDVLRQRNADLSAKNAELAKKAKSGKHGADPIRNEAEGGVGSGGFMDTARQYAKDNKCTMTAALKAVRKENPQLYEDFISSARGS